jgi:hypothetical protein
VRASRSTRECFTSYLHQPVGWEEDRVDSGMSFLADAVAQRMADDPSSVY